MRACRRRFCVVVVSWRQTPQSACDCPRRGVRTMNETKSKTKTPRSGEKIKEQSARYLIDERYEIIDGVRYDFLSSPKVTHQELLARFHLAFHSACAQEDKTLFAPLDSAELFSGYSSDRLRLGATALLSAIRVVEASRCNNEATRFDVRRSFLCNHLLRKSSIL
jgi:hypothetical protein